MLLQYAKWPGVIAVESCTYTCSHGIQPGTAVLRTLPQPPPEGGLPPGFLAGDPLPGDVLGVVSSVLAAAGGSAVDVPAEYGDLVFGDGEREVRLRNCKVVEIRAERSGSGFAYTLRIVDRRWKWSGSQGQKFGGISGSYNETDPRNKLVPWTIREPKELAQILLKELGETNYDISQLPPGIPRIAGANLDRYLRAGENFPYSNTNPEQQWEHAPPADALAGLCDGFGMRVVYQPVQDRIVLAYLGAGSPLPDHPYENISPNVRAPETPVAVGVYGPPIRYQSRLVLEAVGEEWDGKILPINDLSYAPQGIAGGKVQITRITPNNSPDPQVNWPGVKVNVSFGSGSMVTVESTGHSLTPYGHFTVLFNRLKVNAALLQVIELSMDADYLEFRGKTPGATFTVDCYSNWVEEGDETPPYLVTTVQEAQSSGPGWDYCPPPLFPGVTPTDRLAYLEARNLAAKTVWRYYRVKLEDPDSPQIAGIVVPKPLRIPGFGFVKRRQQIVLQPTQVWQVIPEPRIAGGLNRGNQIPNINAGILPDFYNGYSRDRPAYVVGSVFKGLQGGEVLWLGTGNTNENDRVFITPSVQTVDSGDQVVIFGTPVYRYVGIAIKEPRLILNTACLLRDAETNAFRRYEATLPLGGTAPIEWHRHDDLQVGIIPKAGAVTINNPGAAGQIGKIEIEWTPSQAVIDSGNAGGLSLNIQWTFQRQNYSLNVSSTGSADIVTRLSELAQAIDGDTFGAMYLTTSLPGNKLVIEGQHQFALYVTATVTAPALSNEYSTRVITRGREARPGSSATIPQQDWDYAPGDQAHVESAARYYLAGHARKYRLTGGQTRQYIGIYPIDPDGFVQQVTWSMGQGATTVASSNNEHSLAIPPFPARRRAEILPPEHAARIANLAERAHADGFRIRPPGAVK